MPDEIKDLLEKSFGEKSPLTETQRNTRRNAAAFALITFEESFAEEKRLGEMHVNLTLEQIRFAKSFAEVFPKPEDVLLKSEFDSARAGYSELVATPMFEIIPALLANENREFSSDYEIAAELFREDPSGVSYIQHLLNNAEDKATENKNMNLKEKEDEVRAKIAATLAAARDVSDKLPKEKPLDDQSMQDSIVLAILKAFGAQQNPRDAFITKKRHELHGEIPLEIMEGGKMLPTDALKVVGARLAFEHYQTAVNVYLNRWGNKI